MHFEREFSLGERVRSEFEELFLGAASEDIDRRSVPKNRTSREVRGTAEFVALSNEIIRPTMREFSDLLRERRVQSRIAVDGHSDGPSLNVTLRVFVRCALTDRLADVPHYTARWDPHRDLVHLSMSNHTRRYGGTSHDDGSFPIAELTTGLLEKKLLGFMSWVLR